jgi:hypothetical protein
MRTALAAIQLAAWVLLGLLVAGVSHAQTVPGSLTMDWTLPTTGCVVGTTPEVCNVPLTGTAALTAVHVWISTSPIPDVPTTEPTLILGAGETTARHTMQVINGQTLYVRLTARNVSHESFLTAQGSKLIALDIRPDVPTNLTLELTIGT